MIQRLRNQLSRVRKNEDGFGLMELLVSMGLFSILATLIVATFSSFTDVLSKDRVATANINASAVAMDELTRVVRAATTIPMPNADDLPAFRIADKEKIQLYAYIDTSSSSPVPVLVQFEIAVVTGIRCLVEKRWAAFPKAGNPTYWDFPNPASATPTTTRTIARMIIAPTGAEQFLFNYQQIGTDLKPIDMTIPSGGIVTTASLNKIAVVEVTVKVQTDTVTQLAPPALITNQVGIPNLGVSRLALS